MTANPHTHDLETLRAAYEARFAAQDAAIARLGRRRRLPRRLAPLVLAALLVALVPLATLAANPFLDLNPGSPHNGNIDAIFTVGITTGCTPAEYCPSANVTREEMASFLARTAGLGGNPPVANALTAQTATSAQEAANAAALGGYAPSALNRVAFSSTELTATLPNTNAPVDLVRVIVTVPGPAPQAVSVRGTFNARGQAGGGYIETSIRQNGGANSMFGAATLRFPYATLDPTYGVSPHAEWVFVAPPGIHLYTLVARASGTLGNLAINGHRLVATTHPFGATGSPGATEIDQAP